ncbi:MAG: sigma-70 family RNA polymerase sigma factor [Planctomycetes bacterium]|nr:sigma-70 family RNA polymerase sigma factor [Planctomycetota bacterium]
MEDSAQPDLDDVIARVRRGDREAYRRVIEATESVLRVVVAAIVPEAHQVEDVVQDAYVTAYTKLGDYRTGTNAVLWLKAIARNLALNERRRWCREQRRLNPRRAGNLAAIDAEVIAAADVAPDHLLEALRACLDRLGGVGREIVHAFYWSGASAEAIAASSGRTVGSVCVVLHRARAALADCVRRKDDHGR